MGLQRIFTYAKKWDFPLMVVGALAAIGTGVTMPLMNVIFGIYFPSHDRLSASRLANLWQ